MERRRFLKGAAAVAAAISMPNIVIAQPSARDVIEKNIRSLPSSQITLSNILAINFGFIDQHLEMFNAEPIDVSKVHRDESVMTRTCNSKGEMQVCLTARVWQEISGKHVEPKTQACHTQLEMFDLVQPVYDELSAFILNEKKYGVYHACIPFIPFIKWTRTEKELNLLWPEQPKFVVDPVTFEVKVLDFCYGTKSFISLKICTLLIEKRYDIPSNCNLSEPAARAFVAEQKYEIY